MKCPYLAVSWQYIQYWMNTNRLLETDEGSSQSIIDGISEDLHQSDLITIYNSMNYSLVYLKSCIRVFSQLMVLSYSFRFYNNVQSLEDLFETHNNLYQSSEQSWLPHSILDPEKLEKIKTPIANNETDPSIAVTILCGLPGSGQVRWIVV